MSLIRSKVAGAFFAVVCALGCSQAVSPPAYATVSTETRKAGPYAGNDVTTSFAFAFKVFAKADLLVTTADSAGAETTLVLDSDYSVALNADQDSNPGGTVTYPISGTPLATGSTLTIDSDVTRTQGVDLVTGGPFLPNVIENGLDRGVILSQQIQREIDRSLKQPRSDEDAIGDLPTNANRIGKYLAFDSNGDPTTSAGSGTDTGLRTDLADQTVSTNGAGLVGVSAGTNLTAGTVRAKLLAIVADDWVTTSRVLNSSITRAKLSLASGEYLFKGVTTYTSGSGTYTVPAGVRAIRVRMVGGGGGGGYARAITTSGAQAAGGGGQGGYYVELFLTSLSASYAYGVGAAGLGGIGSTSTTATAGGDTTFGTFTAKGGGDGADAERTTSGANLGIPGGGTAKSANVGAAINTIGRSSSLAAPIDPYTTSPINLVLSYGAGSVLSGDTEPKPQASSNSTQTGDVGESPGGGGGGAGAWRIGADQIASGGNGADGIVIIDEFY